MDGLGPLSRWRYSLDQTFYLTKEVADGLGVSADVVRSRCTTELGLTPRRIGRYAGRDVWLFTPEEVENLRQDLERRPPTPGRPQLWTAQERADRHRRHVAKNYWARAAELAHFQGRTEKARRAEQRASELARGLRVQRPGAPQRH